MGSVALAEKAYWEWENYAPEQYGMRYKKAYGFDKHVAWCTCFVGFCADAVGLIASGEYPPNSENTTCTNVRAWARRKGIYYERSSGYKPQPGDCVIYDFEQDGQTDHIGIVYSVDGNDMVTIEGNTSNSEGMNHVLAKKNRNISWSGITGYVDVTGGEWQPDPDNPDKPEPEKPKPDDPVRPNPGNNPLYDEYAIVYVVMNMLMGNRSRPPSFRSNYKIDIEE